MNKLSIFAFSALTLFSACGSHDEAGKPTGATCPTTPASTLTYDNFAKGFMTKYCVECHDSAKKGAARKGAPEFHDFDSVLGIKQVGDHVDEYSGSGPDATNEIMPEIGAKPTLDERKKLSEWIACGFKP
jgi:hypothetical protein